MLAAVNEMEKYPLNDRARFDADELLRFFLLKHVEIIGEAAYKLPGALKEANPNVPWAKIERTRHILVHDYFAVDWEILWAVVSQHLVQLREQIEKIIEGLEGG
jgi:uncharacterized protein with HEPN domain